MTTATTLHWAALSHNGSRKPRNDDAFTAFASGPDGAKPLPHTSHHSLAEHDLVFAIADGMGGANAGHIASTTLLEEMTQIIPETFKAAATGFFPDCLSHLGDAVRSVHARINTLAAESEVNAGMATTLALIWFTPDNIYLANVGDSRIYLSRGGDFEQLSRDHTTVWSQWKRGELIEIEYRKHPRRAALFEIIGGGHERVCPHFAAIPYLPGDRFLICSDGLIDGLWERHLAEALSTCPPDPHQTATALLNRAVTNAGVDDTTLIVIAVGEEINR